ncbi:MAG: hypothetical protein ABR540_03190 [Acidimicrobiales bacterium]
MALLVSATAAAGSENRLEEIGVVFGIILFGAMALLGLLLALAALEVIFGLYRGRPWARWVAVGLAGLLALWMLAGAVFTAETGDRLLLLGLCVFPGSVVALLLTPEAVEDSRT